MSDVLALGGTTVKLTDTVLKKPSSVTKLTQANMPALVSDAHRCGSGEAPEDSFEAAAVSVAGGVTMLDMDAEITRDGKVILMHDSTLTRTTNLGSTVVDRTLTQVMMARIDAGDGWAPGWGQLRIPTVAQMLDLYADRVYMTVEAKNPSSIPTLGALIRERNLTGSVYINSNRLTDVPLVHAEGCLFHFWSSTTSTDVTNAANAGVDLINIGVDFADSVFATAAASSIPKIFATGVIRRNRMARVLTLATTQRVRGWISDYPLYVGQPVNMPAPYSSIASRLAVQKLGRGWIYSGAVPVITTAGKIRLGPGVTTLLLGDMSSSTAPSTTSLRYRHQWVTAPANTTTWCGLRFGSPTDGVWGSSGSAEEAGYTFSPHYDGTMDLTFQPANGTATSIGTASIGSALGTTQAHAFRVDITPTTVKVTHENSGTTLGPITHSTVRGGYIHLAQSSTDGVVDVDLVERV